MKDIIFGISLAVLSVIMYVASLSLPNSRWEPLGSGSFPRVLFVSLFVLSLVVIVQKMLATRGRVRSEPLGLGRWFQEKRIVVYCFLLLFIYIISLKYVGFIIATVVFLSVFQWMLDRKHPHFIKIIIISVSFTFPVYYLFMWYLNVYLP